MSKQVGGVIDIMPFFKVGDLAPKGYLQWHEWAKIQYRGGLRQVQQPCGHWLFPQEVSKHDCSGGAEHE